MRIPFAGGAQGRLGGADPAVLDLADYEDDAEAALDPAELPSHEPNLLLQRMENRLVRHTLDAPEVLTHDELRKLRYILNFARLTVFEPGAAGPGGGRGRGDVSVGAEVTPWQAKVADALQGPLREERDTVTALAAARRILADLTDEQDALRSAMLARHGNDFSAADLDTEVGYKKLVTVLGGGGGAGFVYIGGMQRLLEAGHVPDYMIGSSFGSIMASVVARALPVPIEEYVAWAKTVSYRAILGPERRYRRHGLTGLFSLRFDRFAHATFTREDGAPMRMTDLAIPTDAVIAGVRKRSFDALPPRFRRQELAALRLRFLPHLPIGIGPQVAARMWQVAAFIDSRVVKAIVVGGDDLTRDLNVVDVASLSSAIPGVLHHETSDPAMLPILDTMLQSNDCGALIDGGMASNVPVELAWKRVRDGRLGTRNACYLAFDCFHPQWDPRQLWMAPIAHAIRLQTLRNTPYADHLIRFTPTLSPMNLAPSSAAIDRACGWGSKSVDRAIPVVTALLEPIWWDGDGPPAARARGATAAKFGAPSMNAVLAAMQLPHNRFQRWRDRHLT